RSCAAILVSAGTPYAPAMERDGEFGGVIGKYHYDSKPWWPPDLKAPAGAPNVLLVVLDDVGFAQLGSFGSDLETPAFDGLADNAGCRARWPRGRGFERWYGFFGGETHQFAPALVCDNHQIDAPRSWQDGYHLTEDLIDEGQRMIANLRAVDADKPFFMYLGF